jgi:hypothetical protein
MVEPPSVTHGVRHLPPISVVGGERVRVEGFPRAGGDDGGVLEMNCDELVERVTDYLEGALGREDRVRLDDHRGVCIGCEMYLGEVQVTLRLVSSLPAERMSDELEENLLATYRTWAAGVSR